MEISPSMRRCWRRCWRCAISGAVLVPLTNEQELDDEYLDGTVRPKLERALELAVCEGLTRLAEAVPAEMSLHDLVCSVGRCIACTWIEDV